MSIKSSGEELGESGLQHSRAQPCFAEDSLTFLEDKGICLFSDLNRAFSSENCDEYLVG
mgnify:CR=1 FL=1